jgi:hypothetical protein
LRLARRAKGINAELDYTYSKLDTVGMTLEAQIKNLELRLQMAIAHVVQAQTDLDAIRWKAGLPPATPLFHLTTPGAETGWPGDNGVDAMRARQRAKAPSARAEAEPRRISPEVWARLAESGRRARGEPDPAAPIDPKATADAIVRAAAKAKGQLVELPPVGSPARAILESGAKRRSETLEGKPL